MVSTLLQIAAGGALGASARFLVAKAVVWATGPGFPLGILTVNVAGSFLMGLCAVVALERGAAHLSPFLMTGFLGGFTTFSAFSLETLLLIERGQAGQAVAYVTLSVGASLGALYLGLLGARALAA